ncbi:MAG: hypothetical protein ABIM99_06525 [Candidatus Dojkabacteria bacterium]
MRKHVSITVTFAILAIFSSVIGFSPIYAQEAASADKPAEIKDFDGLRAEFKQETQDPDSKNITFNMILKSNINSDRVRIDWTLSGTSKLLNDKDKTKTLSIKQGETYTIPITITPTSEGVTEIYGTAQSVNVDSSFLVTVRKNFAFNNSLEVLPITSEYTTARTLSIVKSIVLVLLVASAILGFGFIGLKRIMKYLRAGPDVTFENEVDPTLPINPPTSK